MDSKVSLLFFIASLCITQAFFVSPPCGCSPPSAPGSPCGCQSQAVAPAPQVIYLPAPADYSAVACSPPSPPPCTPAPPPPPCTPAPPCAPAPPVQCSQPPKIIIATPITLPIACAPSAPAAPAPAPSCTPAPPCSQPCNSVPPPPPCTPAPPCNPAPPPPPPPCTPAPPPSCGCSSPPPSKPCGVSLPPFPPFPKFGCDKCTVFDEEALFRGPPCKCNCHNPVQAPNDSGDVYMKKVPIPRIPADPVSIAIAVRAAQRTYVPEGQLEYGFKKKPIDLVRRKVWRNIPEEKLYSINSKVIEFKKPNDSDEDEFKLEESDEEDDSTYFHQDSKIPSDTPCFAYSDIGYSAMDSCDQKFRNIPISTTPNPCNIPLCESELTGRIINIPEKTEEEKLHEYITEHIRQYCSTCELT